MYTLCFDGLFRNINQLNGQLTKAGLMCYGWLVMRNGKVIGRGHGVLAQRHGASSNASEYLALIEGLEGLCDLRLESRCIRILGDSKSVIEQMQGLVGIRSPEMRVLHSQANGIARRFKSLNWTWLPRRDNRAADSLSRRALSQFRHSSGHQQAIRLLQSGMSTSSLSLLDFRVFQPVYEP